MTAASEIGALRRIRREHEELILALLRANGAMSRADLGQAAGLSRSTLAEIVADLLGAGVVRSVAKASAGRGRPAELLTLSPESGQVIGLDFGKRRVHAVITNVAHEVIASGAVRYPAGTPWPDRVRVGLDLVPALAASAGANLNAVQGIGVGVTGPGEEADDEAAIVAAIRDRFGAPVRTDINTRMAALGEAVWGVQSSADDSDGSTLYVRLSDGVGGGVVLDGRLLRGASGAAGEIGHVSVDHAGPRCPCGGRGCLELYASVPAVLDAANHDSLDQLRAAVVAGEPGATAVLARAGDLLGAALASACNVLNPGQIVVAGELAELGDALLRPARETLADLTTSRTRQHLLPARLGDEAGALGGVALILQESPLLKGYA